MVITLANKQKYHFLSFQTIKAVILPLLMKLYGYLSISLSFALLDVVFLDLKSNRLLTTFLLEDTRIQKAEFHIRIYWATYV